MKARSVGWLKVAPAFIVVGLLLYSPALMAWFASDDFLHLARVADGGLPFMPDGRTGGFLRPLIGLSFWVEYQIWGLHAFGYHLVNVLLHIANSLMVVKLALLLLPQEARRRNFTAVGAGLVFLAMACHAEPVSWISGRTDVLAAFFMLAALCAGCIWLRGGGYRWAVSGLLFSAAALLSKESALALPFVLIVCGVHLALTGGIHRTRREIALSIAGFVVLFMFYVVFRRLMIGEFIGGYGAHGHLRFYKDLLAQAMSRFGWRVYLPPLPDAAADWIAPHSGWLGNAFFLALIAITLFLALLAWKSRPAGMFLFLFCAFWASLAPAINMRVQWTNSEGERFLYLASVFAAMGAACLLARLPRAWLRATLLAFVLAVQGAFLVAGAMKWRYAGAMAKEIIHGLQSEYPGGTLILANKPDAYDGALVLRTGLPDGLRHFGPAPLEVDRLEVLFATGIYQPDHTFEMDALASDGRTFHLYAADPTSTLVEEDHGDLIETLTKTRHEAVFQFHGELRDAALFVYDSRGLRQVEDISQPTPGTASDIDRE